LVEHDLAKVGVAGSSPGFFFESKCHPGGGTGRHVPIKIGIRSNAGDGNNFSEFKNSVTRVVELVDTQDLKSCSQ
jgi:hypothetical protein